MVELKTFEVNGGHAFLASCLKDAKDLVLLHNP